jgi:uncharacterized membrane protein (Fun14 family)
MTNETIRNPHPMPAFQKAVLVAIVLVLVVSVAVRMLIVDPSSTAANPMPAGARSFATQAAATHPEDAAWWQSFLPAVTEASLFGLIGFAMGHSTRQVFRFALLLIAAGFVVVQIFVARGTIEFEWGPIVRGIQAWILNLRPDVPVLEFLKTRVPTALTFAACWFVGFRRG